MAAYSETSPVVARTAFREAFFGRLADELHVLGLSHSAEDLGRNLGSIGNRSLSHLARCVGAVPNAPWWWVKLEGPEHLYLGRDFNAEPYSLCATRAEGLAMVLLHADLSRTNLHAMRLSAEDGSITIHGDDDACLAKICLVEYQSLPDARQECLRRVKTAFKGVDAHDAGARLVQRLKDIPGFESLDSDQRAHRSEHGQGFGECVDMSVSNIAAVFRKEMGSAGFNLSIGVSESLEFISRAASAPNWATLSALEARMLVPENPFLLSFEAIHGKAIPPPHLELFKSAAEGLLGFSVLYSERGPWRTMPEIRVGQGGKPMYVSCYDHKIDFERHDARQPLIDQPHLSLHVMPYEVEAWMEEPQFEASMRAAESILSSSDPNASLRRHCLSDAPVESRIAEIGRRRLSDVAATELIGSWSFSVMKRSRSERPILLGERFDARGNGTASFSVTIDKSEVAVDSHGRAFVVTEYGSEVEAELGLMSPDNLRRLDRLVGGRFRKVLPVTEEDLQALIAGQKRR